MINSNRLEEVMLDISKKVSHPIIVLKGFDCSTINQGNKYFNFILNSLDTVELDQWDQLVIDTIIEKRSFKDQYQWMTIEEYQLFRDNERINKNEVVILNNNLYNRLYPYFGTLNNIEEVYTKLYFSDDTELNYSDKKMLERVSKFYGTIDFSSDAQQYYVTYPDLDDSKIVIDFFNEMIDKFPENNFTPSVVDIQIELFDNDIPFLDLIETLRNSTKEINVLFLFAKGDIGIANNYRQRISILSKFSNANFYFSTNSIKRKDIKREDELVNILNEVFMYKSFRNISFYEDIESKSKCTIEISQVQIIDDIVEQAERAMNNLSFKDVFITASTGAGKSVMFQVPALYLAQKYPECKPLTLVISPLIGLMNDQVDGMRSKGINNSATINGDTPPYEREKIIDGIQKQEIDILYLSPETLQARSDIKVLIGDRSIGIVIIDEAHIVTTWGKSFRADYWYLGIYLSKLRKEYKFPIVTFTATSIYGGKEDMYLDTRNSLNMINPISYFGVVRRDDIKMVVRSSENSYEKAGRDYKKTKNVLALKHLEFAHKSKQKSLIYFPTISLLLEFSKFVEMNNKDIYSKTGRYYGPLSKEEKDEVLYQFKTGEIQFVLATKAFGMGIDIPDITNVYHFAPTGNVVDYIQEIGRAARDNNLVPIGFGWIDFLPKDMNEIKKLQGMSAIRKDQIIEVMRKIVSLYKEKGNDRNLIVSSDDFKYIFNEKNNDEDNLDNKVKTVLLMIEKDFSSPNKLGYSPIVARPRSVFGSDLILVTPDQENEFLKSRLGKFFTKKFDIQSGMYSAAYFINLSGIWEQYYKNMSFPKFKFSLSTAEERDKLRHKTVFEKLKYASGISVSIYGDRSADDVIMNYRKILDSFEEFVTKYQISEGYFSVKNLGDHFSSSLQISDKFKARSFAQALINSAFDYGKVKSRPFLRERSSIGQEKQFKIQGDPNAFKIFVLDAIKSVLNPDTNFFKNQNDIISFFSKGDKEAIDGRLLAVGIGEARDLLSYQLIGGSNPQIYMRVNAIFQLEKAIAQGSFYKNDILTDVRNRHLLSVEMLKYLFLRPQEGNSKSQRILNYSTWFWDTIENYFMGIIPEEVRDKQQMK